MAKKPTTDRPIRSVFYTDYHARNAVKINRGKHPESMVLRCIDAMRHAKYGDQQNTAVLAEVFDEDDGVLHAIVKRKISGDIEILYQRGVKD